MSIVAFTGHRDLKNPELVHDNLRTLLSREKGFAERRGITGGAIGVDMIAAEVMYDLGIPYELYAPCFNQDKKWPNELKKRYQLTCERATNVRYIYAGDYPGPQVMWDRNEAMVDDCDFLVAVIDPKVVRGGTVGCVAYATKVGRHTIKMHPETRYTLPQE